MKRNERFQVLCEAIARRHEGRAVIKFSGEHDGETMLVDFSSCGEDFDDNTVCVWSLQKDIHDEDGRFGGTEEEDWGTFTTYEEAMLFAVGMLDNREGTMYYDSF